MFKLYSILCTLCVLGAFVAHAEPDGNYILSASSKVGPSTQSNAISSEDNSNEANDGDDGDSGDEQPQAPASVSRISGSSVSAAAAARGSYVIAASSVKSGPSIHHHILPAETIPLPITISTRPGIRTVIAPETITIHEPTVAKVGEVVQKIPTAVSHQSQTVVHKHARVVTPIVAPAVRTITSQVLRAYHTPIVYAPHASAVVRVVSN